MERDPVGRRETRVQRRGASPLGASGRARRRPTAGPHHGRTRGIEPAAAGELRTATRERNSEESLCVFRPGGARPPSEVMVAFIDDHRPQFGVEPICAVLPIAPSTYYRHRARQLDLTKRSARAVRDEVLKAIIQRIWHEHDQAYGSRKVWKQMGREGLRAARCRVRRLMRELGLVGVTRGRAWTTTTQPDAAANRPADLVHRQFTATRPNQLWLADFTYVATWQG